MKRVLALYTIFLILMSHSVLLADGNPPRALRASSSDSTVYLKWTPPINEITGYLIYRSLPGEDFEQLNSEPVEDTFYEDADVIIGQYYIYKISAIDEEGYESPLSNAFGIEASEIQGPLSGY